MGWLQSLQKKSHKEKLRIIWATAIVTACLLITVWIFTSHYSKTVPKDTSIFQVISRGFNDLGKSLKKK